MSDGAPVVPISAELKYNVDVVCEYLVNRIPIPERNFTSPPNMIVIRSFDVNKHGSEVDEIKGVAGGCILRGVLRVNQLIEFSPGIVMKDESGNIKCIPIYSRIVSLYAEQNEFQFAVPGGLIGVGTTMDPTLTRADRLVGQVLGEVNSLFDVFVHIAFAQLTVGYNLQSTCYWLIGDACLLKIGAEFKLGIEHWKLERKLCDELTKNKDVVFSVTYEDLSFPTDCIALPMLIQ